MNDRKHRSESTPVPPPPKQHDTPWIPLIVIIVPLLALIAYGAFS